MQMIKYIYVFVIIVLSTIFLSLTAANAQMVADYRFLEVVDTDGKPVAGATIETLSDRREVLQTDQKGQLSIILRISSNFEIAELKVAKPGYFSYEDIGIISGPFTDRSNRRLKLELLKISGTAAERRAVEDEQRKREFFLAAKNGDSATVRKLLQAGLSANLTTTDLRGVPVAKDFPVIIFAVTSGDGETFKALLAAGADVRNKDQPGHNVLLYYLSGGFSRYFSRTEPKKANLINIYEDGLKKLIKAGADVKVVSNDSGQTTLMLAAYNGTAGMVKILLDKGVSVDAKDKYGDTALMKAVSINRVEIVNLLLKSGADPNVLSYYFNTCHSALINAVQMGDVKVIQILAANKADVNLGCQNGDTALITAVRRNHITAVKTLIEAGADLKGKQGQMALMYAKERQSNAHESNKSDYQEIIKLLEAAGAR